MSFTPAPPKRRRPNSEARITAAARRLFLMRGLDGVNMDLIAAEAGVARQTLYNRFGSKDAVFEAAISDHWQGLADVAAVSLDPDRPPRDVLADVASGILAFVRDRDQVAMTRMVIAESLRQPALGRTFFLLGKGPLLARFVAYLSAATARGRLSCADPALAARQYLGMIQESLLWPEVMGIDAEKDDCERVVRGAIGVFLKAYGCGDTCGFAGKAPPAG